VLAQWKGTWVAKTGKKELIVKTAIGILLKQNYENMTTASIAKKANISEGTIYTYFGSKRELFIEILREISIRLSEAVAVGVSEDKDLRANLRILGENFFTMPADISNLYRIIYKAFSEVEDKKIKAELEQVYVRGLRKIREVISLSLKNRDVRISEEKIEAVLTIMWGIGDMIWKRSIISGSHTLKEMETMDLVEMISRYMESAR
jgi:AcrR family transcriptional regulator